jgi:hypothetical protein
MSSTSKYSIDNSGRSDKMSDFRMHNMLNMVASPLGTQLNSYDPLNEKIQKSFNFI